MGPRRREAARAISTGATFLLAGALAACTLLAPAPPAAPATGLGASPSTPPLAPRPTPVGPTEHAGVTYVYDGDTVKVDIGFASERVRLVGINAPEVGEPWFDEATDELTRLVDGRNVVLERDRTDRDRFERLLRYVWVENDGSLALVNLLLVERGFAQARVYGVDDRYADILAAAQRRAQDARLGIWAVPSVP
jgi:micrococcal nuclease